MKAMRPFTLAVLTVLALDGTPSAQQQPVHELRRETFEIVWTRVKERHFDPQMNGVDWEAMRRRYQPRVGAAQSDEEFHRLLNELLGELKQSHFAVFPPSLFEGREGAGARAGVGMEVQWIEGRAVIARVELASPAAEAGLRPGLILTAIGGESLDGLLERGAAAGESEARRRSRVIRVARSRLQGPSGSVVAVGYLDQNGMPAEAALTRRPLEGPSMQFGDLPALRGQLVSRELAGGFGYLRINVFLLPMLDPIRQATAAFHNAPGVILDLRGALGGDIAATTATAGLFSSRQTTLGSTRLRDGEMHRVVYPSPQPYTGPLVILVDEGTRSAAETFAAAMQENGRALIVGRPTGGYALPSVTEKLPTGAVLQYAIGEYRTPKGIVMEGRGVQPDVPVEITRGALLAGRDEILERAVTLMEQGGRP